MAASFWGSLQHKSLVPRERLAELHVQDRAKGLTEEQIQQLYVYHIDYMQQVARQAQTERQQLLRMRVVCTAAVYFRKFYLRNCFCTTDPRCLALAALFLASKTEEAPIHAKLLLHYARRLAAKAGAPVPGDTHSLVVAEATLVEQLDCDLLVFSPHPSLAKLLRNALPPALSQEERQAAAQTAWSVLNDSYRTPLHLLHPPHILALGCLYLMAVLRRLDLRPWLEGLNTDFNQVYDVCSELLSFYERHRQPIDTPTCLRYLELLGLPQVLQQAQQAQQQGQSQQQGQQGPLAAQQGPPVQQQQQQAQQPLGQQLPFRQTG